MKYKVTLRDKYGWPLELIEGRPITNAIRVLVLTRWLKTWKYRHDNRSPGYPEGYTVLGQER